MSKKTRTVTLYRPVGEKELDLNGKADGDPFRLDSLVSQFFIRCSMNNTPRRSLATGTPAKEGRVTFCVFKSDVPTWIGFLWLHCWRTNPSGALDTSRRTQRFQSTHPGFNRSGERFSEYRPHSPNCHPFARSPCKRRLRRRLDDDTSPRAGCCEVAAGYRSGNLLSAGLLMAKWAVGGCRGGTCGYCTGTC